MYKRQEDIFAVYPRLRGERASFAMSETVTSGLSPASRGTPDEQLDERIRRRFIPGFAGNATVHYLSNSNHAVYPRLRGERIMGTYADMVAIGLSPASRGTQINGVTDIVLPRFIPGFAGNAFTLHPRQHPRPVYPRLRGERTIPVVKIGRQNGLSPASRGTLVLIPFTPSISRFIPGFAGNA